MYIQSLTLMAMVVMVFGNPTPTPSNHKIVLLGQIKEEANNLKSKNLIDSVVFNHGEGGGSTCLKEVFCLAEKALKDFPPTEKKLQKSDVELLTRVLTQYNKGQNCTLKTDGTRNLTAFLDDVVFCANKKKNN